MSTAPPSYNNDKPPSYQEAMIQAYQTLEKKFKEDPDAASHALAEALGGKDVDIAFVGDLKDLTTTITTLKTLFKKVHDGLFVFDAENYKDTSGNLTKFAKPWGDIRTRFDKNLAASRTLSTEIKERVQVYFKDILPMLRERDMTEKEKLENLTYFVGEQVDATDYNAALKNSETRAEGISQEFASIQTAVYSFKSEFDAYFASASEELDTEITNLKAAIKSLAAELASLQTSKTVSAAVAATGSVVGGVAASAMAVTGVLAPVGMACVVIGAAISLGASIGSAKAEEKIVKLQADMQDKKLDLDKLIAKQERLNTVIKPLVAELDSSMVTIGDKLGSLTKIMEYIKLEAQEARVALQECLDSKAPFLVQEKKINLSVQLSKKLYFCVDEYSKGYDAVNPTL